ncbi:MAG: glycosyltransferase family 2 protein [Bacteroidota bacterium]
MDAPKVSVIIPNYNHGVYLKQRIESVLNQTLKDFELIILDDCSTDNSREIINAYADYPSVKQIVFNDRNSGNPFKQWQKGIELTSGEWIWIAESDDYADERFLEKMITAVRDMNSIGLVYCDSNMVSNNIVQQDTFAVLKNRRFNTDRWSKNYRNSGADEIENYLLPGGTINNSSAVLFNRHELIKANPFDVRFRYIGDKYAFIKVLACTDVLYVKERLNYYRDPFNTKHADEFVFYFYEQFLVFNWVKSNMEISDRKRFLEGFYLNTHNSLFRDWNITKISLYGKLFRINPILLLFNIYNNFFRAVHSVFTRI